MWVSSCWRHLPVGLGKSFLLLLFLTDDEPLFAQCRAWLQHQKCWLLLLRWAEVQVQALKLYLQWLLEVAPRTIPRAHRKPTRRGQLWPECTCRDTCCRHYSGCRAVLMGCVGSWAHCYVHSRLFKRYICGRKVAAMTNFEVQNSIAESTL